MGNEQAEIKGGEEVRGGERTRRERGESRCSKAGGTFIRK